MNFEKFIYYPRPNNRHYCLEWKSHAWVLQLDKEALQGWLIERGRAAPFVIYYGGNAEDVSCNLEYVARFPSASFLFMNYRGFGGSSGQPSEKHLFSDALAVYDHIVKKLAIFPSNIVLMGRSLGSSVAAYVASQRTVGGLILVTPFDSMENVVSGLFYRIPVGWIFKGLFTTAAYLSTVQVPMLVLAAEEEEVIPKKCLTKLVEAYKNQMTLVTIPGADHQNLVEQELYFTSIDQYIKNLKTA